MHSPQNKSIVGMSINELTLDGVSEKNWNHAQQHMAWVDGKIVKSHSPAMSLLDQSYLSGMGVFETIRAEAGGACFLSAHMERLSGAASLFGIHPPEEISISRGIEILLARQNMQSAKIRLTLSNEIGPDGIPFRVGGKTRSAILAFPLHQSTKRIFGITTSRFRIHGASSLSGIKCTSYALNGLAMVEARRRGFDDALMLDTNGNLVGCTTANLFWVRNGMVFTPDSRLGCRVGVTRERLMHACRRIGISCSSVASKRIELNTADEIFVTSAIRGVRSVSRIDEICLKKGPITRRLKQLLDSEIRRNLR